MKKIVVVLLSVLSLQAFSQKPTGKIVVKSGQHFVVQATSDMVITQEMMGQSMEMKVGTNTTINTEIKDTIDNNYAVTQTVTNIKSTFSGMGKDNTFDSDKKEDMDSEAGALFKDKINVPSTSVIAKDGKPVASADTTKSEQDSNPMAAMMNVMGSGQDVAGSLFLVIPVGKKAGDTWQDSLSKEGVTMKRTFTLNSIANKVASVTVDVVMDIDKKMDIRGMEMNAVLKSKSNSTVLVDMITSMQKENKSTTDVTGTVDMMGQAIPLTAKVSAATSIKGM